MHFRWLRLSSGGHRHLNSKIQTLISGFGTCGLAEIKMTTHRATSTRLCEFTDDLVIPALSEAPEVVPT